MAAESCLLKEMTMLLGLERSHGFAWHGASPRQSHLSAVTLRRRAKIRRQGRAEVAIARRFQPRLAAGFGDEDRADDGLEPFDRGLGRNPFAMLIGWLAGL